ncbi:MAG: TIGR03790 family protein [Verrucomicrobiales bacterium]|nr:TIGR03790 family protein [Verrucomicrobiales bacterium]
MITIRRLFDVLRAWLAWVPAATAVVLVGGAPGEEVAVIYNSSGGPDSIFVAEHYARLRAVPKDHLIGLRLPKQETMTRAEFEEDLMTPLVAALKERGLLAVHGTVVPARPGEPGRVVDVVTGARIRYLVLCYGVPLRIARDTNLVEAAQGQLPEALQRNEAAVDSELAFLVPLLQGAPISGPGRNPFQGETDPAAINPIKGLFMVARLDGPTPDIARALVDKAIEAEQRGLWGRAWFDLRGLKSGAYKMGDDWIRAAAGVAERAGFETVVDEQGSVFPDGFPMPQIGLYAGWYAGAASGPFAAPEIEFMPGAVAYHLHSFSASTIRSAKAHWVGPLLAKGVAATMGCVFEPYLGATPDVGVFFDRLVRGGFTFGEAAYAAQPVLSWQTTVVGDPLYRPFGVSLAERRQRLETAGDPDLPWALLQELNVELGVNPPVTEALARLGALSGLNASAVLQQRLAELQVIAGHPAEAAYAYRRAIDLKPSPEQRVHLQLALARLLATTDRPGEAVAVYEDFLRGHADRAGLLAVYREALPVAEKAGQRKVANRYQKAIDRLAPPPAEPKDAKANAKAKKR